MKKLLSILSILSCFTLFSCNKVTKSDTNLPTEVNRLRHTSQFDTILVIKTDKKIYEFDYKTQNFIKSTNINQDLTLIIILILLFCIYCFFVLALFITN